MRRSMRVLLGILVLAAASPCFAKAAEGGLDTEPGLVAEYFALAARPETWPALPAAAKPAFVRVEAQISHSLVTGDFHGTRLSENFYARWTGILRCPENGLYNFYVESDDGCRLAIDQD